MDALEIVLFVLIVIAVFCSPFVFFKILSVLKTRIEKPFEKAKLANRGNVEYQILADKIRVAAIGVFSSSLLGLILALIMDSTKWKIVLVAGSVVLGVCSIGIWARHIWAVWATGAFIIAVVTGWAYQSWPNVFSDESSPLLFLFFLYYLIGVGEAIARLKSLSN